MIASYYVVRSMKANENGTNQEIQHDIPQPKY